MNNSTSPPARNFVKHGRHQLEILSTAPTGFSRPTNFPSTMDANRQEKFLYMFERLCVPLFMGPRGKDNNLFNVPTDGMTPKQMQIMKELQKTMVGSPGMENSKTFTMKKPQKLPDIKPIGMACPREEHFSFFLPVHREAAAQMISILMNQQNVDDFLDVCGTCRDSSMINSHLWFHSVVAATLRRKDMRGVKIPAIWEVIPDLVFSASVQRQAAQQALLPTAARSIILVNGPMTPEGAKSINGRLVVDVMTGRNENPENKLAYFREDVGVASHHWHWHVIFNGNNKDGVRDRRGELFYYMHHAMIARYEAERLSNGLPRVRPLDVSSAPVVEEGYFSKLTAQNSGLQWGARQENTLLRSVSRTDEGRQLQVDIEDMRKWKDRISDAIDTGVIFSKTSSRQTLKNTARQDPGSDIEPDTGIDILGNLVESAESYSANMQFYGNLHNMGHVIIGFAHDPEKRHNEKIGPMGSEATALRDPVFFRWHKFIDDLFDKYKQTHTPYREEQLKWNGVRVTHVEVQSQNVPERNNLRTNLRQTDVDLGRGLDLNRSTTTSGEIWARITHLDHVPFVYNITVVNELSRSVPATVRIFIAPQHNEQGEKFHMSHQRLLFIEMDKFAVTLRSGQNQIARASTDSSVTIPWDQSFRDLEAAFAGFRQGDKTGDPTGREAVCGCGWPQHLLVPRGNSSGVVFDLVVMVTDGSKDQIPKGRTEGQKQGCKESVSFCGILDSKYPDLLPMGFPWDRLPRMITKPGSTMPVMVSDLNEFIPADSNIRTIPITITHNDKDVRLRENGKGAPDGMDFVLPISVQEQLSREGNSRSITFDDDVGGAESRRRPNRINNMNDNGNGNGLGWRRVGPSSDDDSDEDEHF